MSQNVRFIVSARDHDLGGGVTVRRVLPSPQRVALGPFVFIDHFGPVTLSAEQPLDVRPHPHIGLATLTYLWQGRIEHRDSLGSHQIIEPGAVNWMTSGRGVVHSERTAAQDRGRDQPLHGLQLWLALPGEHERAEPAFAHVAAERLPQRRVGDATLRVAAGLAYGERSPVAVLGEPFLVDATLDDGGRLPLPDEPEQRGVYVAAGELQIDGATPLRAGQLAVFDANAAPTLTARGATRAALLGGAPLDAPRYLWWNFVASSEQTIEQAKRDWREGRFAGVAGDDEFIPLPERREAVRLDPY